MCGQSRHLFAQGTSAEGGRAWGALQNACRSQCWQAFAWQRVQRKLRNSDIPHHSRPHAHLDHLDARDDLVHVAHTLVRPLHDLTAQAALRVGGWARRRAVCQQAGKPIASGRAPGVPRSSACLCVLPRPFVLQTPGCAWLCPLRSQPKLRFTPTQSMHLACARQGRGALLPHTVPFNPPAWLPGCRSWAPARASRPGPQRWPSRPGGQRVHTSEKKASVVGALLTAHA